MSSRLASPGEWPGRLRRWHHLASAPLALIILFYAITGFTANRSDLFVGEDTLDATRTLPADAALDRERLIPVLAAMLPDGAHLTAFADGPPISASFDLDDGRSWTVSLDPASRMVRLAERGTLPPGLEPTPAAIGDFLETRLSGTAQLDQVTSEDGSIELELASVWGTHVVRVDLASRTWTSSSSTPPLVVSLTDLHRGKHAGRWQRVIIDIAALVLALVTLSGIALPLISGTTQRRRQALLLLTGSIVLLTLLLVWR